MANRDRLSIFGRLYGSMNSIFTFGHPNDHDNNFDENDDRPDDSQVALPVMDYREELPEVLDYSPDPAKMDDIKDSKLSQPPAKYFWFNRDNIYSPRFQSPKYSFEYSFVT